MRSQGGFRLFRVVSRGREHGSAVFQPRHLWHKVIHSCKMVSRPECRHDSQKTCTKDGVMMSCSFLEVFENKSPPLSHCPAKKVTGLTREAACLSVSHWRLLRATCAGEWDHFRFRFRDHQKNKTKVFVCHLWNLSRHVISQAQEEESCDEGEPPVNYRAKKQSANQVTTWFEFCGKLRAKVRREGIGRLLDLRPDMPRHAETCRCPVIRKRCGVVFVFHAYVSQVNVLGLGYTTHPVLEGNNLKTEEGQSEGQRQQPFLHESRVNHLAILWLVTFCDQTFPWNDCPRQNKDITTWPQQNLEGRAWIGGSMLSRKLMEIME